MEQGLYLFRGFLVGLAGLLPGMSGSAFLVLFGMYRPLTTFLAHPLIHLRKNLRQYAPFFLAALAGLLVGSRLLAALFERQEVPLLHLFTGFMIGTLPDLYKAARKTRAGVGSWITLAGFLAACVGLAAWEARLGPDGIALPETIPVWFATGISLGLCSLLPGVNVAFLYIHFGIYQPLLEGVASLTPRVLFPVAIGAAAAILVFAKIVNLLFRIAEGPTHYGILGLIIGSVYLLYPGLDATLRQPLLHIGLLLLGLLLSLMLNQIAPPSRLPSGSETAPSHPDK
ncbi:MAG: DUF368 domain-containing protein [Verrucomicrobiota bacterium]|jgi:putative membrane protein|nr:DUF368 domain-containing protein [Verrucomicrobiota bacterium]